MYCVLSERKLKKLPFSARDKEKNAVRFITTIYCPNQTLIWFICSQMLSIGSNAPSQLLISPGPDSITTIYGPPLFGLHPYWLFTFGLFMIDISPFGLPLTFGLSPFGLFKNTRTLDYNGPHPLEVSFLWIFFCALLTCYCDHMYVFWNGFYTRKYNFPTTCSCKLGCTWVFQH